MNQTEIEELRGLVIEACTKAIKQLQEQFGVGGLASFTLCTDDDLCSLDHIALSKQSLEKTTKNGMKYLFTEWDERAKDDFFGLARKKMSNADYPADGFDDYVVHAFGVLVDALLTLRNSGLVSEDTLLFVGCGDPSDHIEEMAADAALKLNDQKTYEGWREFVG